MRTYGRLYLDGKYWCMEAEPHVLLFAKRVFKKVDRFDLGHVEISNTAENCRDVEWFLLRYPLEVENSDALKSGADAHRQKIQRSEEILFPSYTPRSVSLAIPARDYQLRATELLLNNKSLLLADELGLGKSLVSIAAMTDPSARPALVVVPAALTFQWRDYINKFAPSLKVHITKKSAPYTLPDETDVIVTTYFKLYGWADVLSKFVKMVTFDEVQELRRSCSDKYRAAKLITGHADYVLGLSATPIYNYGGEYWNVSNIITPGAIGTRDEFEREWCTGYANRLKVKDARAFGSYLRENFLMLRRTRVEVGRELPPVIKIPHTIESDARELERVSGSAGELARIILGRSEATKERRFTAGGEFDMLMRQATGIAKAPYVADFVTMLCESGEKVILCGHHRAVYAIWEERLRKAGLKVAYYTGSESPLQKEQSKRDFINPNGANVLFLALRSGVGIDGFQEVCSTIVFGELDWAYGIHEQLIGRLHRDGARGPVMAYYLISEDGSDPVVSNVLGIKREQVVGIQNPNAPIVEILDAGGEDHIKQLAESYLTKSLR